MSTSHHDMENARTQFSFDIIDARIQALEMESGANEELLPAAAMQRFLAIYASVKPILTVVSTLPLFPQHWRNALRLFLETLDTVASFKAGKDI
jgi:hypothetical protein